MRRLARNSLLAFVTLGALAATFLFFGLQSYSSLSNETLIAELSFEQREDGGHYARLTSGDRCTEGVYVIYGEQWRIDAQFVKWKYWANVLGLGSRYRLDRLQGRFRDVAAENSEPASAHSLNGAEAVDLAQLAQWLGNMNPLFDAAYGSSTYHSIDTNRIYRVYKTPTGIITRSEAVRQPVVRGDVLDLEIDKACGQDPTLLSRLFAPNS